MPVMRTLRDVIDHYADAQPDAPFLFAPEPGSVVTYGELRESSRALAGFLADAGVLPGEVVSFMLPNGAAAATLLLGTMVAGYVVSPLNLLAQDAHLEYTLAHSDTRLVFAAPEFVDRIRRLLGTTGRRVTVRATDPDLLHDAPHTMPVGRLDEAYAARCLNLCWKAPEE